MIEKYSPKIFEFTEVNNERGYFSFSDKIRFLKYYISYLHYFLNLQE
jgi:hypothetical protein